MSTRFAHAVLFVVAVLASPVMAEEVQTVKLPGLETPWTFCSEDADATASDTWTVEDGVLRSTGEPLGYLRTEEDYGDFTLSFQYRWPERELAETGKGGLLFRMTGKDKIWPKSLEAQINAGGAGDFWGLDGYELSGPEDRMQVIEHPDFGKLTNLKRSMANERGREWNYYRIQAKGDRVTLWINGKIVNEATKCETEPGKLVLTSEGTPIEFREFHLTVPEAE